jgi:uncharacterized membrane protein HdeD (DUF308 family)
MAYLFFALMLFVLAANLLFGLSIPTWVFGLLALIVGVLFVMEHFRVRADRKDIIRFRGSPPPMDPRREEEAKVRHG